MRSGQPLFQPPVRRLGFWPASALVVGHTIGVGIFLTPAEVIGAVGSPALTFALWVGCGALVFAGALTFGELSSRYPRAGGLYVYLREGWSERVAFLYGWQSLLVMDPGVLAVLATGVAPYATTLWPAAAGSERWVAIALIWILAVVAASGLVLSARVMIVLTALKVTALALIVLVAFSRADGNGLAPAVGPVTAGGLAIGLIAIFFSFGGFWEAGRIADAVIRPSRTMPLALTAGVVAVTIIYIATTAAFMSLVSARAASTPALFARLAGEAMFATSGPAVLAGIVTLSVAASMLGLLMMAPRLYSAMSADGLFPARIAAVDRAGSPALATVLLAALATLLALAGTFRQIMAFFMCSTLAFVALAAAALVPLRRRPDVAPGFRVPAHPWPTLFFVGLLAVVLALVAVSQPLQAFTGFAVVGAGIPAFRFLHVRSGAAPTPRSQGVET